MLFKGLKNYWQDIVFRPFQIVERSAGLFIKEAIAAANPQSVLDIGCGDMANRKFVTGEYIGLEYSSDTKERSLESKRADVWGDARQMPFADQRFDMVLATCVLEHIYEKEKVVREVCRVLKKRGHFLLRVPQSERTHEAPFDFFRFTKFGIMQLLADNGFQVIKIAPSNRSGLLTAWYTAVDSLCQPEIKWRRWRLGLLTIATYLLYCFLFNHYDVKNKEHPVNYLILAQKP